MALDRMPFPFVDQPPEMMKFLPDGARGSVEYVVDALQRNVLFLDALRQRGNQYLQQEAEPVKHVLRFKYELVMSGLDLERPVNYGLVRILPPEGVETDPASRPFVVVDPRAGHAPGIGGFKEDSEVGVILRAGHPCYFIGFVSDPVPGQTIEDVLYAEAEFMRQVADLHPESAMKPCIVANCQAGWAMMMMAATAPETAGPIIIAGAPLSYWAGVRGKNPMRYTGGMLGGSWMATLAGDLGNGIFDGAYLVQNFENLNPANTLWSKQYNLWSKIDTEALRYLEFERWWGGHVLMNAEEMQFIADELFVGNKLTRGEVVTSQGMPVDLRNIRSPILVFCSWGDNITPPQQALGWVLDLYADETELITYGQTIVYSLHHSVGHLGIFVSGSVGRKEHDQFTQNMDLVDVLSPGLYEAVIREKTPDDVNADLAYGDYIVSFERRGFDDLRALGGNTPEDDRSFETVARVSEMNQGLYQTLASPWVKLWSNEATANLLRETHPLRLQYSLFSDKNPFMAPVANWAEWIRGNRQEVSPDNPWLAWQSKVSEGIVQGLDAYRDWRDSMYEALFFGIYGSAPLQAAMGLRSYAAGIRERPRFNPEHEAFLQEKIHDLRSRIGQGGVPEAIARAILYVGLPEPRVDERGFALFKHLREDIPENQRMPFDQLKLMLREQFYMLLIDEEATMSSLRDLLPEDEAARTEIFGRLVRLAQATGAPDTGRLARMRSVAERFGLSPDTVLGSLAPASLSSDLPQGKPRRRGPAASARKRVAAKR